jgi:hypothetical protein
MLTALVDPPAKFQLFKDPRCSCGWHLYTTRKTGERERSPTQLRVSQRRAYKDKSVCLRQLVFREEDGSSQAPQRPHYIGNYENSMFVTVSPFHFALHNIKQRVFLSCSIGRHAIESGTSMPRAWLALEVESNMVAAPQHDECQKIAILRCNRSPVIVF